MGEEEIGAFLSSLAVNARVSASTQNQAFSALVFLYREVLRRDLAGIENVVRARVPRRLPVVMSRDEVARVLAELQGTPRLMAMLLYGSGLRLFECAGLRIKDADFGLNQIVVRDGKGEKDRVTLLPAVAQPDLARHIDRVRTQHQQDLARGAGWVELPFALGRKYPEAGREWGWQWVFPATRSYFEPETRQRRRHHLHESVLQREVKEAVRRAGIPKPASCHTFTQLRDPFARGRLRHPHRTGVARSQGRQHDHDLHARAQPWPGSRPKLGRPTAEAMTLMIRRFNRFSQGSALDGPAYSAIRPDPKSRMSRTRCRSYPPISLSLHCRGRGI